MRVATSTQCIAPLSHSLLFYFYSHLLLYHCSLTRGSALCGFLQECEDLYSNPHLDADALEQSRQWKSARVHNLSRRHVLAAIGVADNVYAHATAGIQ